MTDDQIEARFLKGKPGPKPTAAAKAIATPINEALLADDQQALNTLTVIERSKQDYDKGRDLVNQMLGQAQAFNAAGDLLRTFGISKMAMVKENKLYQQLKGMRTPNGSELTGTWAEFCELLGMSDDKANEDINNLRAFGEQALEQMQKAGIGYRDLRQFRRLPADQKTELIEAAKAGDTATLLELAEDLIVKHNKERNNLQLDLAAKDQRIARHATRIQELEDKADRFSALPVHAQVAESAAKALGLVQGELRQGFINLVASHTQANDGTDSRVVMAGHLGQLQQLLNALRQEFALADVVGDSTPEWKKWAAANPDGHPNLPDSATWRPAV